MNFSGGWLYRAESSDFLTLLERGLNFNLRLFDHLNSRGFSRYLFRLGKFKTKCFTADAQTRVKFHFLISANRTCGEDLVLEICSSEDISASVSVKAVNSASVSVSATVSYSVSAEELTFAFLTFLVFLRPISADLKTVANWFMAAVGLMPGGNFFADFEEEVLVVITEVEDSDLTDF